MSLVWDMVRKNLDEEAIRVKGRQLRARRGTSGDYEIVTAPNYFGKYIAYDKKCLSLSS